MSALWAYTGRPDGEIERRLAAALRHRGHMGAEAGAGVAHGRSATIGVALAYPDHRLGGLAVAADGSVSLAVAGRLDSGVTVDDVLARYRCEQMTAIETLKGEWIVAVLDDQRLVVVRDPVGVRTVYWGSHDGRIVIGVEPKAVLAMPGFPRRLDPGAVGQFLTFSFVPGERCALLDLRELPAGHRLEIDLASHEARVVRWFIHEDIEPQADTEAAWLPLLRTAVDHAIESRVPEREPVAAFLSGGLDSSIVVSVAAAVRRQRGEPPPSTFSLHFGADCPNELSFAQEVADRAGTDHHVVEVAGRDVAPMLREMIWHLDEPIGDPVTAGNFALARAAAEHARWVLNGEGGDPVFGGPKNLPMLLAHWYPTLDGPHAREERYLASWRRAGEEVAALLHPDLRREFDHERDLVEVVRPFFAADRPVHFLNKLMVANMRLKGAHLILPKVDRMLGAHGLTPLSPLFDVDVMRSVFGCHRESNCATASRSGSSNSAYDDLLPLSVIGDPKSGMRVPVHEWFQRDLRREAKDLLSPKAVRRAGVFDARRVQDILKYRTGRDGLRLWMLVTFELWRRMIFEPEAG